MTETQRFSTEERARLLALHGVGPKIIERLEQMGFSSLEQLRSAEVQEILAQGSTLTGSSCWKNSPQAKAAIQAVLELASADN